MLYIYAMNFGFIKTLFTTTMARPKLTIPQVKRIKELLKLKDNKGNPLYTQTQLAKKYGVSRPCITKIATGMRDPLNKNGRWGDIEIGDNYR